MNIFRLLCRVAHPPSVASGALLHGCLKKQEAQQGKKTQKKSLDKINSY